MRHDTQNRVHFWQLKAGITRTPEFEKKGLATHAVNVGVKCGHGCLYCSTGAMLRTHKAFKATGEDPFGFGYAIVDTTTPQRVARDAEKIQKRGMVQLCTTTDAWSPEAQEHGLSRRCLQAILSQPGWSVRILTKNAAVAQDFDLLEGHRDRVLVGLSLTATPARADVVEILEPHASSIQDRMLAMVEAAARGLRTYAMLCPLLPGIADCPDQIEELVRFAVDCRAEEIFIEPVNPRGRGLPLCHEALETWGYDEQAAAIARIRNRKEWSRYVAELLRNAQQAVRQHSDIRKLRFLLYPGNLMAENVARIKAHDEGVIWLGK